MLIHTFQTEVTWLPYSQSNVIFIRCFTSLKYSLKHTHSCLRSADPLYPPTYRPRRRRAKWVLVCDRRAESGLALSLTLDIISFKHTHCSLQFDLAIMRRCAGGTVSLLGFCKTCHNKEQSSSGQRGDISFWAGGRWASLDRVSHFTPLMSRHQCRRLKEGASLKVPRQETTQKEVLVWVGVLEIWCNFLSSLLLLGY